MKVGSVEAWSQQAAAYCKTQPDVSLHDMLLPVSTVTQTLTMRCAQQGAVAASQHTCSTSQTRHSMHSVPRQQMPLQLSHSLLRLSMPRRSLLSHPVQSALLTSWQHPDCRLVRCLWAVGLRELSTSVWTLQLGRLTAENAMTCMQIRLKHVAGLTTMIAVHMSRLKPLLIKCIQRLVTPQAVVSAPVLQSDCLLLCRGLWANTASLVRCQKAFAVLQL